MSEYLKRDSSMSENRNNRSLRIVTVLLIALALTLAGCTGESNNTGQNGESGEGELVVELTSGGEITRFDSLSISFSRATLVSEGGGKEEVSLDESVDLASGEGSKELSITGIPTGQYTGIGLDVDEVVATVDGESVRVIGFGGSIGGDTSFSIEGSASSTIKIGVEPIQIEGTNDWTIVSIPGGGE